ncbi:hypothetical protein [Janibacter sp. UYMM211]|uniref:hypothetical protein n=1 Tax=Janibacter sp. UYMM211 TaxID=3156342 RepID=UPI0033931324
MAKYRVHEAGVARAHERIEARQYVLDSTWTEVQPGAERRNAYLERHSWQEYAQWHLGLCEGAGEETKGRYAFAYGDLRRVHRSALIACVYRASEWHHKSVELAAHDLLQHLDVVAGIGDHE